MHVWLTPRNSRNIPMAYRRTTTTSHSYGEHSGSPDGGGTAKTSFIEGNVPAGGILPSAQIQLPDQSLKTMFSNYGTEGLLTHETHRTWRFTKGHGGRTTRR